MYAIQEIISADPEMAIESNNNPCHQQLHCSLNLPHFKG